MDKRLIYICMSEDNAYDKKLVKTENLMNYSRRCRLVNLLKGRPVGTIEVLRELSYTEEDTNSSYSFEKAFVKVDLVRTAVQYFLLKTKYSCSAENNGRPVYYLTEEYYRVLPSQCEEMGEENWKEMVSDSPAFCYRECREGALYYKVRKK